MRHEGSIVVGYEEGLVGGAAGVVLGIWLNDGAKVLPEKLGGFADCGCLIAAEEDVVVSCFYGCVV